MFPTSFSARTSARAGRRPATAHQQRRRARRPHPHAGETSRGTKTQPRADRIRQAAASTRARPDRRRRRLPDAGCAGDVRLRVRGRVAAACGRIGARRKRAYAAGAVDQGTALDLAGKGQESRAAFERCAISSASSANRRLPAKWVSSARTASSRSPINTITGHTDGVMSVAWLADNVRAVSTGEDGTIRIWDVRLRASWQSSPAPSRFCPPQSRLMGNLSSLAGTTRRKRSG